MEVNCRTTFVSKMTEIMGEGKFIYGGYKNKPVTPYSNYALDDSKTIYADGRVVYKRSFYIVRLVTDYKDFELESKIESMLDENEICWERLSDEWIKRDKVYCSEWVVCFVEN